MSKLLRSWRPRVKVVHIAKRGLCYHVSGTKRGPYDYFCNAKAEARRLLGRRGRLVYLGQLCWLLTSVQIQGGIGNMSKYGFPYLECSEHPGPQPGYMVCSHVLEGATAAYVSHPENESVGIGDMLCESCDAALRVEGQDLSKMMADLKLVCKGCALRK